MGEAERNIHWIADRNSLYAQALRVVISCGRELTNSCTCGATKYFLDEGKVELLGKGGKTRRIRFLRREIFEG